MLRASDRYPAEWRRGTRLADRPACDRRVKPWKNRLSSTANDGDELRKQLRGSIPVLPNRSNRIRLFGFKSWPICILCSLVRLGNFRDVF